MENVVDSPRSLWYSSPMKKNPTTQEALSMNYYNRKNLLSKRIFYSRMASRKCSLARHVFDDLKARQQIILDNQIIMMDTLLKLMRKS